MKIRSTNLLKSRLDLSSQEQLGGPEIEDHEVFRATIGPNQTITVDDKWYPISNIQGALKAGLIEILEYKKVQDFEIRENESTTTNYSWELPQIEFVPNYPYEELIKYNAIFNSLDTQLKNAVEGYDQFQELLDTPNSFTGEANKVLIVKDTEDGIEFVNLPHSELLELNWSDSGHTIDIDVDFADYGLTNVNHIDFNLSPTGTTVEGELRWNPTDETLDLGLPRGVVQQIGQELVIKAINKTGADIPSGSPVYFSGRQGNRPKMYLALSEDYSQSVVMGLTTEDVADNSEGFITSFGYVRGIKTNYSGAGDWGTTWVDGDSLYVSKTVPGQLTNVEPDTPHHGDIVGNVAIVGPAGIGSIEVNTQRHKSLIELSDVNGSPVTESGQIVVWDNDNEYFDFTENIYDYGKINGGTLTEGSIVFSDANGDLHQDNVNLFWDDTNNRLGIGTNSPSEKLDVDGNIITSGYIETKYVIDSIATISSTPYTLTDEQTILVDDDTVGSIVTINLPTASGIEGKTFDIKKKGNTAKVIINPNGTETIDGDSNFELLDKHETITIKSDGTNWWII